MVDLRPLIIVTGTIRVEGGETNQVRKQAGSQRRTADGRGTKATVVRDVSITDDRLKADVITTGYARRLQRLRIVKTPFGALVDAKSLDRVKMMLQRASADVIEFNSAHKRSKLSNCYLWERLSGNRLEAVRGWIDRQLVDGNKDVQDVLILLTGERAAAA